MHLMNGSFKLTNSGPACVNEQSPKPAENASVENDTFPEECLYFLCVGAFPTGTLSLVVQEQRQTGLLAGLSLPTKQPPVSGSG